MPNDILTIVQTTLPVQQITVTENGGYLGGVLIEMQVHYHGTSYEEIQKKMAKSIFAAARKLRDSKIDWENL